MCVWRAEQREGAGRKRGPSVRGVGDASFCRGELGQTTGAGVHKKEKGVADRSPSRSSLQEGSVSLSQQTCRFTPLYNRNHRGGGGSTDTLGSRWDANPWDQLMENTHPTSLVRGTGGNPLRPKDGGGIGVGSLLCLWVV
jgi:hypothetical protein